jgi:hypothetical protein
MKGQALQLIALLFAETRSHASHVGRCVAHLDLRARAKLADILRGEIREGIGVRLQPLERIPEGGTACELGVCVARRLCCGHVKMKEVQLS